MKQIANEEFPQLKPHITIIRKTCNEGLPQARKTGIEAAQGDYIMHCDSDDWIHNGAIEIIMNKIKTTKSDVLYYNYFISSADNNIPSNETLFTTPRDNMEAIMSFMPNSGAYCWNKVARRSLYKHVEEWPIQNMHEDIALMPQILQHAQSLEFIETPLYHYRSNSSTSMSQDFSKNKKKKCESKNNQLILLHFLQRHHLTTIFSKPYHQMVVRCAYIAAFFDRSSILTDLDYHKELLHCPLYKHFDVSLRRQIQSRLIIYAYSLLKKVRISQRS